MSKRTAEVDAQPIAVPIANSTLLQNADPETGTLAILSGEKSSSHDDSTDVSRQHLEPSEKLTGHQIFYILGLDGLGAMVLSAGVNFAIAYAMYTTQDTIKNPIRLFQLPNTLSGDAAVTTFVQCILTWFVELGLVAFDLRQRSVQPIGFVAEPTSPWLRWWFMLPVSSSESEPTDKDSNGSRFSGFSFFFQNVLRGFILAVIGFLLTWPIGVGALTAFGEKQGGDYLYSDRWVPEAFKGIMGGCLGLFTTPPMAVFWLLKAGWRAKHGSQG